MVHVLAITGAEQKSENVNVSTFDYSYSEGLCQRKILAEPFAMHFSSESNSLQIQALSRPGVAVWC